MQETNINKHLHHKEPLVPYSDRTRCLYHAEALRCNGGGVCAIIKSSLDTRPVKIDGKYGSLELISFDIFDLQITYRFIVYYRPNDDLSNINLFISAISSLACDDVSLVLNW